MDAVFLMSLSALLLTVAGMAMIMRGSRRIPQLSGVNPPPEAEHLPSVSIVVPARDEAHTIEPALRTLLALDYPALELIAINDRSTDATPRIMDTLASEDRRLRVIHIDTLPEGWLGKTHALHRGAREATGRYLLFTDADIHMAPETLRLAIGRISTERLDHLVVLPRVIAAGDLLRALMILTITSVILLFRPWAVRTRRRRFMGSGAFNLVRRAAYDACGGHQSLALAPVDDIELGRIIKHRGFSQGVAHCSGLVTVEWYPDVRSVVLGLEKNAFAAFDFRFWKLLLASLAALLIGLWPLAGLVFARGAAWWVNLAAVSVAMFFFTETAKALGWNRRCVLALYPAVVLLLYIWWRAAMLAQLRGGIVWRGTFHRLAELKSAHSTTL